MPQIPHKMVREASRKLIITAPFFATLFLHQKVLETRDIPTFAVDGVNLYYNPDFADTLTFDEIVFVLAHEMMHLALLHHTRMGSRDAELWNEACDYAINGELVKAGTTAGQITMKMPKMGLIDPAYTGKSAEDIYRILSAKPKQGNGGNKGNQSQSGGNGTGKPANSNQPPGLNGKGNIGGIIKPKNPAKQEKETQLQVATAMNAAKSQGHTPLGADRIVAAQHSDKDWREKLNRFLTVLNPKDYSWMRPNKRFLHSGIILPSLHGKTFGKIAIAVDTSGSIGLNELAAITGEVFQCLRVMMEDSSNIELPIIYCDAAVQGLDILSSEDDKPNPKGGGGTAFAPVFRYIEENKDGVFDDLIGLVYLTDGQCFKESIENPPYETLWMITTDSGMTQYERPFGEDVRFDLHA